MDYFITESRRKQTRGSCFFEFQIGQKGKEYESVFWLEDSLLLHMDIADEIELYKIVPDFNYYYITIIDKENGRSFSRMRKRQAEEP